MWQKAMELSVECKRISRLLPREELFRLGDQILRAARSIPANIAEGYGSGTRPEYRRFLWMARRSALELHTHLASAERERLLKNAELSHARELLDHTSRMLTLARRNLPP